MLDEIQTPADVKRLPMDRLPELASELRREIIETVSSTGGHLASSLGAVELTIALARVFDLPEDKVLWDVGHQTYAWKLLTGRRARFGTLRRLDGLSGFTKREESPYDSFIAGHAGNTLSAAIGYAAARDAQSGQNHIIAVIGDASFSNGITLEALNNLRAATDRLIIILNDNEMSISKNVGAFSRYLGRLLSSVRYNRIKQRAEETGHRLKLSGLRSFYHRLEQHLKSFWLKNLLFEEAGVRYVGPVDGHSIPRMVEALTSAQEECKSPILIHAYTQKGKGYPPAERDPTHWHGVGPFNPATGLPPPKPGYSEIVGTELATLADKDARLHAITAAMAEGTGLNILAYRHANQFHDVGICEEHAVVFAGGLAAGGLRPVFAVYASFFQRAVDCVMHDICLQNLPVLFCVDRAGIVGADGPTHHGLFDIAMLRCLPNIALLQPADGPELKAMMRAALSHQGPVAIRYPRTKPPAEILTGETPVEWGKAAIVQTAPKSTVYIWALGDLIPLAQKVAARLPQGATIVNPRFIKPIDKPLLLQQAQRATLFVTLENAALEGGFGSALLETLADADCRVPVERIGWPDAIIPQGGIDELFARYGLTADAIAHRIAQHEKPTP